MAAQQQPAADLISLPQGGGAIRGHRRDLQPGPADRDRQLLDPARRAGRAARLAADADARLQHGQRQRHVRARLDLGVPGDQPQDSPGRAPLRRRARHVHPAAGGEDLVPVESVPGGGVRYRPRTEGLFARIVHWHDPAARQDYWEVTSRDGVVSRYGTSGRRARRGLARSGRRRRPGRPAPDLRLEADARPGTRSATRSRYDYADDAGQDGDHRWRQPLLRGIRYADYPDRRRCDASSWPRSPSRTRPGRTRSPRTRPASRSAPRRRYRAIPRLSTRTAQPVRRYEFGYQPDPYTGTSLLTAVALVGFGDDGRRRRGEPDLPPLRLRLFAGSTRPHGGSGR